MWQKALNNGLVGGLVSIALTLIGALTGINDPIRGGGSFAGSAIFSVIGIAVTIFFIRRAMIQFRDEDNGGVLSYGQGLGVGILTAIVMALVGALYILLHLSFIDTEALDFLKAENIAQMEKSGISEDQIEQRETYINLVFSKIGFTVLAFFLSTFYSFIISLIVAAITKRDAA